MFGIKEKIDYAKQELNNQKVLLHAKIEEIEAKIKLLGQLLALAMGAIILELGTIIVLMVVL